jgi:predicted dehydrogenase
MMKALVQRKLGRPLRFHYTEGGLFRWPITSKGAFELTVSKGGVLWDKGSHVLDLLLYVFGSLEITDYADNHWGEGVETDCFVQLKGADVVGSVALSWRYSLANEFRVASGPDVCVMNNLMISGIKCCGPAFSGCECEIQGWYPEAWSGALGRTPRTYAECIEVQLMAAIQARNDRSETNGGGVLPSLQLIDRCYGMTDKGRLPDFRAC